MKNIAILLFVALTSGLLLQATAEESQTCGIVEIPGPTPTYKFNFKFKDFNLSGTISKSGQTEDNVGCAGEGKWQYSHQMESTLADDKAPFITDEPPVCEFEPGEQEKIVNDVLARVTDNPGQKIAIFLIGAPGVGKSTSLTSLLKNLGLTKNQFVVIDPDEARSHIKAYQRLTNIPSASCHGKLRAYATATLKCIRLGWDINEALLSEAKIQGKSMIYDTPCKDTELCQKLAGEFSHEGYKIYALAVYAAENSVQARAKDRAYKTGRYINSKLVGDFYATIKNSNVFSAMATVARDSGGNAFIYDNEGKEARLIYDAKEQTPCSLEQGCQFYKVAK